MSELHMYQANNTLFQNKIIFFLLFRKENRIFVLNKRKQDEKGCYKIIDSHQAE